MKIIIAPSATQYRHEVITAEARLWRAIRGRRLNGFKFLRQVPRGPYICDFLCAEQLLAVEIGSEAEATGGSGGQDLEKVTYLEGRGYLMLRLSSKDVIENLEGTLGILQEALCRKRTLLHAEDNASTGTEG
jgi:very-short-patch-repair endonuclease